MLAENLKPDWAGPAAIRIVAILAAAVWGAVFGSFVNVVVHRLPRGESPVSGRSRCPRCRQEIRARDNIPILGWLLRRGACRACGGRISVVYPLVETACGLLVAVLAAAAAARGECDRLLVTGDWSPLPALALQAVTLLCLVAWALLEQRGMATCPGAWLLIIALVASAAAFPAAGPPGVMPGGQAWPSDSPAIAAGITAVAGAAAGRLGGWSVGTGTGRRGLAVVGAAVGWQAVTVVTLVTTLVRRAGGSLAGPDGREGPPWTVAVVNTAVIIATLVAFAAGGNVLRATTARRGAAQGLPDRPAGNRMNSPAARCMIWALAGDPHWPCRHRSRP